MTDLNKHTLEHMHSVQKSLAVDLKDVAVDVTCIKPSNPDQPNSPLRKAILGNCSPRQHIMTLLLQPKACFPSFQVVCESHCYLQHGGLLASTGEPTSMYFLISKTNPMLI